MKKKPKEGQAVKVTIIPATSDTMIAESPCPTCKAPLNRATGMTESAHMPTPGAFTICAECGEILVFDEKIQLRLPNETEMLYLKLHPEEYAMFKGLQQKFRAKIASGVMTFGEAPKPQ